jgi:hypothetical protein
MAKIRRARRRVSDGEKIALMAATMPAAAALTLAHRLPILAGAALDPRRVADPEIGSMVVEKALAGLRVAHALGDMGAANQQAVLRYLLAQSRTNLALAEDRPGNVPANTLDYGARSFGHLAAMFAEWHEISARAARFGLASVHDRVVANARRLARRPGRGRGRA